MMETEAENCSAAKAKRRRSKRYSGLFHEQSTELRTPLADAPHIENNACHTAVCYPVYDKLSDPVLSDEKANDEGMENGTTLEQQTKTTDNIKKFDEYMLGIVGEEMMKMAREDVLSKADPGILPISCFSQLVSIRNQRACYHMYDILFVTSLHVFLFGVIGKVHVCRPGDVS